MRYVVYIGTRVASECATRAFAEGIAEWLRDDYVSVTIIDRNELTAGGVK